MALLDDQAHRLGNLRPPEGTVTRQATDETFSAVMGRAAIIALAVALMTILETDLYRRAHSHTLPPLPAIRYDEGEELAADEEAEIYGPDPLVAAYRAGYAWAQAEGIDRVAECPGNIPTYRNGCADFVVGRAARW
ncbi:MAG: hypothetical protein M3T55_03000 [Pseudomonadota bacterium]|nr:hypothetical protein [Pseudomonadota bacterium]